MKKYAIPLILSLITFSASYVFLDSFKTSPSEIIVELDAIVQKDDVFQVFYQQKGMTQFKGKQSVNNRVKGNRKLQKINFELPIDKPIKSLRVDIGGIATQKLIKIKSIKLISSTHTQSLDINDDFKANKCITSTDEGFKTHAVNGKYNPFFRSLFDVKNAFNELIKEKSSLSKKVIILLSLIISVTLFFVLYYSQINVQSRYSTIYVVVFVLILISPVFVKTFNIDIESDLTEKRKLAEKPEFNLTKTYPQEFELYYNDNFGLRTTLVNWNSKLKLGFFNMSPRPARALFGKDKFLFSNREDIYNCYSNTNLVNEEKLEEVYQKQVSLKKRLAKKNIKYIIGFFPLKYSIYKENLPFAMEMQIVKDTSLADQIVNLFKSKDFPFVDVREDLINEKNNNQMYLKFDTHWNAYGAYMAYRSFCEQTFNELNLTPFDTSHFNITYYDWRRGDLVGSIGLSKLKSHHDVVPKFVPKTESWEYISTDGYPKLSYVTLNKNCGNKKTVIVFGDSYMHLFRNYLSMHYYKVIYIRSNRRGIKWETSIDIKLIEKANADIVITLCLERFLTPHLIDFKISNEGKKLTKRNKEDKN